jgi:hypothetical protein
VRCSPGHSWTPLARPLNSDSDNEAPKATVTAATPTFAQPYEPRKRLIWTDEDDEHIISVVAAADPDLPISIVANRIAITGVRQWYSPRTAC